MKKLISLLLCLLAFTSIFAFIPDPIHITEFFSYLVGQPEQMQVCTSGSYEWYGEIIEGEDTVLMDTVFDWKARKVYSIEYTEDGEEVEEYHELTFNKDFLVTQDIWVDCDGELILDYEYAPDYSSYKCYATEEDGERYLWDEYYIKKTSQRTHIKICILCEYFIILCIICRIIYLTYFLNLYYDINR